MDLGGEQEKLSFFGFCPQSVKLIFWGQINLRGWSFEQVWAWRVVIGWPDGIYFIAEYNFSNAIAVIQFNQFALIVIYQHQHSAKQEEVKFCQFHHLQSKILRAAIFCGLLKGGKGAKNTIFKVSIRLKPCFPLNLNAESSFLATAYPNTTQSSTLTFSMQKPVNRKSLYKKANKIINKICTIFRVFQKIVQVGLQVVKFKIWGSPIFCAGIIKKWVIFQDGLPKDTQKCWYQWVGFESEKILKATKLLCLMRKTRINLNTLRWVRYKLGKLTRSYNKYIMLSHPPGNLQTLITNALIDDRYREAIQLGLHKYQIKQFKIDLLCPQEVFAMHYVLSTKFYSSSQQSNDTWWENELRLFIWALVCYSYLQHRCVSQMNSTDWLFFSEIFNHRSPDIFEFQALSILKRESKFSKWTSEQIKLLDSIIKSKNVKNKWSDIAKNLFLLSQKKYFRTSKQCREYWINHLDPTPLKSEWNLQEDLELLKAIKVLGKRWSKVSKKFRGRRTQHMVKNRYKSLFQFQQKRLVGQSNKTLSEDQIISVLEKRLRSAIQEQKIKSYQQKQELSKTKGSAADKFSSAEDQKLGDPIEELLMESVNQMHGGATDSGKLPLEYDTIQSMGCHVESPFQIQFSMNRSQMAEDQDFGSFFHKEYYFNL